ncbi:MAG: SDR family oxidoreductase [Proteobacteria bacterium]|nr:SDR family oxidoreductase [Pseudomonadota bacterium]
MTNRLFVFGLGFSGREIARQAKAAGWSVAGTVRGDDKAQQLAAEGIETHLFDGTGALPADAFGATTHVLCTIAPGSTGDPVLRLCASLLRGARWLGYLSTTGVYGDRAGGWVDETTPTNPSQPRSAARLATERAWQAMGATLFRLPGIYGPGRSAIDQVKAGTARRIDKPGQVFSRIHVEDIAATVLAAIAQPSPGALYNVADDLPASTADVIAYACELLAVPVPPLVPWAEIAPTMSAMARSFYAENRRVRNDRIKRELGVRLRYPTYREGLRALVEAQQAVDAGTREES